MKTRKQIVFVNQSSGYLMIDIIDAFKDTYENRILMTGFLNPRNKNLDANVKVEWLPEYNRTSSLKRILTWSIAFTKALVLIKFKYRKAHLFLVSNPPMAPLLTLFCRNSFSLLIYDIYPDALAEFGYFNPDSWLVRKWENANRKVFSKADKISTLTEGMQQRLSKYVDIAKIQIIPIWTDNAFLKPIPKSENDFLKAHQLQDKFIVMYSGNMGKSHPVEILVQLAVHFQNNPELYFLLIGGGDKYSELENVIQKNELQNIQIMPWQDTSLLPLTLSGADLALVTVGNEASNLSIPSKTYNLMSVGVPILCIANKDAALSQLINHHQNGKVFSSLQIEDIRNFILKCQKNKSYLENMKNKSLEASAFYTPDNAKLFSNV